MSRSTAIALAEKYNLQDIVAQYIDELGYSPADACREWDIL